METMRRLLSLLMALGLFGAAVGCHHTAGVCDCDDHGNAALVQPPPGTMAVQRLEPIPVMPQTANSKPGL
jgi:hypothetical protein